MENENAIHGEFQHALVIADVEERKIGKVVRKTCLLKDLKVRKRYEEKVAKLVDVGAPNLWGHFKDGVLMACDEVYG